MGEHDYAMNANDAPAHNCSINLCINSATHEDVLENERWRFVVHYCREHYREIEKGTPVGPLGLNPANITIEAQGTTDLRMPGNQASPVG
jgi:hypothetical protein